MEKGKLYINKTKKVIVLCSSSSSPRNGLFKGVVIYTNDKYYSVGDYTTTWIGENFVPFNGKLTDLERKNKLERILKKNN